MDVHLSPELEEKLKNLAAKTGQAPEELLDDALAGYETSKMAALDWFQCAVVRRAEASGTRAATTRRGRVVA